MALILANRVQESATANTTVSFTLSGAVQGFQSFSAIGNGNTTYYSATDSAGNWEVGLGTYSITGPTLTRTTIYASSNSGSAVTFSGAVNVFVTYPSGKSVNLDATGNVSALGTVASGTWQGSTVGVAYGGTGVTASSGANSVMLRDSNQNVAINRLNQANTSTTATGGTTVLTAASSYSHTLVGTGNQTFTLPDATTLTTGVAFLFNNMATGTITIQDYASATIGTITAGGAGAVFLINNSTVGGTWDIHGYLPEGVTWGTNALNLGTTVISNGTWQGGTIQPAYGGTGLTTFVGANNALYSTGATTLTAGTLPVAAGGTGVTTTPTNGQLLVGNGTNYTVASLGTGTGISTTTGSGTLTINNTGVTSLAGTSPVTASASTGSVTMSLASGYGDTQNPYASKTANFFLAAPNGTAGAPTFRAIVAADIPTLNQNTTGSAGSVVNAVTFNNGGAGDASGTTFNGSAARTISYNTVGAPSTSGTNATGTWGISISGNAATATSATSATNVAGGAANRIPYNTAAGTTSFIAAPTVSTTVLRWTGSAFSWAAVPAAGSNTQIQYNSGGNLGGSSNLTTDGNSLTVSGVRYGKGSGTTSPVPSIAIGNTNTGISAGGGSVSIGANSDGYSSGGATDSSVAIGHTALGSGGGARNIAIGPSSQRLGYDYTLNSASIFGPGFGYVDGTYNNAFLSNGSGGSVVLDFTISFGNLLTVGPVWSYTPGASNTFDLDSNPGPWNNFGSQGSFGSINITQSTVTVPDNVAVGASTLYSNTTGYRNVTFGSSGLYSLTSGLNNTAIGYGALYGITTASNNTAIGYYSGYLITTGERNTIVGCYTGNQNGLDIRTKSNYTVLSDGDGNPRMVFNATGVPMTVQPAPTSKSTTATLTGAEVLTQILNTTGTTYTVTMPTGTDLDTATGGMATNTAFDFTVINTASGTITMAVNTNITSLGSLSVATGTSASYKIRKTAANTFVMYRL